MNDIEIVFLLYILFANLMFNYLIYRQLSSMLNNVEQINRRLRAKAMLEKETKNE